MFLSSALRLRIGVSGLRAYSQQSVLASAKGSSNGFNSKLSLCAPLRNRLLGVAPTRPSATATASRPLFAFRWHSTGSGDGGKKAAPSFPTQCPPHPASLAIRGVTMGVLKTTGFQLCRLHRSLLKMRVPVGVLSVGAHASEAVVVPLRPRARARAGQEPVSYDTYESSGRRQIDALSDGQAAYLRRVWAWQVPMLVLHPWVVLVVWLLEYLHSFHLEGHLYQSLVYLWSSRGVIPHCVLGCWRRALSFLVLLVDLLLV